MSNETQVPDLNARNNFSFLLKFFFFRMYICILYVYRRAGIWFATYANRISSRHARQGEPQHVPRFDRRESHANCRMRNLLDNRSSCISYWRKCSLICVRSRDNWFHGSSLRRIVLAYVPETREHKKRNLH